MGIAAAIMTGSVFLSRIIGYLRDAVIAYLYGATAQTDVYFAAFTLPDFLNYLVAGGALSITLIPILSRYIADGQEDEGWRLFSIVISAMSLLVSLLIILGETLTPLVIPYLFPGFTPQQTAETVHLTRIVIPAQLFFYTGGLLSAVLYTKERFTAPALSPLIYNVCIIAGGILLGPLVGIAGFSWGVLLGAFLGPFLLPLLAVLRLRPAFSPSLHLRHPGFVEFLKLSLPLMLGISLVTADEWIARYFGSSLDSGTISRLNNARRLMMVPIAVFGQAMGQASLPFFSRLAAERKLSDLAGAVGLSLRTVIVLTVAASAWIILLASDIIATVYGRGRYTPADVTATGMILVCFAVGIVSWGVQGIVARGFYAMRDTLTPMVVGTAVTLASLPLYAALMRSMEGPGLALATTCGMCAHAGILILFLRRKLEVLSLRRLVSVFIRISLAAGIAALAAHVLLTVVDLPSPLLRLTVVSATWGILTLILALLLRIEEVMIIVRKVGGREKT
jgi:putative peptidoglycan lipid II flippase